VKLYAGIDGGQTSTTAVLAAADGKILGTGHAGPADEVGEGSGSTKLRDAFHLALNHALRAAQLFADTEFAAVVAGLSGYNGKTTGAKPSFRTPNFELLHDTRIAHAAAFGRGEGVLVIAGTGSVAYGTNDKGEECRAGGWGYLFGDEGSAFWIGRRLIERAMHDRDDALRSPVTPALLKFFEVQSVAEIRDGFYGGAIGRAKIGALAQTAFACAAGGIDDARFIVEQAADALAALAARCARRLHAGKRIIGGCVPVAFTGGLMGDEAFRDRVYARLSDRLPEAQITAVTKTPAEGALLLALRATVKP
jgi:N-acetylglucosamine kinase-like BadF-type ATPase